MRQVRFHQTRMGQEFFLMTMPALGTELQHIAGSLRKLVELLSRRTPRDGAVAEVRERRTVA